METPKMIPFSYLRGTLALALAIWTAVALAAPKPELLPRWIARDAESRLKIDHSSWATLLHRYVRSAPDGINRFAYADVTAQDRALLDRYVAGLEAVQISRNNPREQLAYWINLYNALTVKVVLDHYPVDSIRDIDISPGLFANGPWGKKLVRVEGEALSLDDIEHGILRPIWRDPRIHYAVNCAALGCPNLMPDAFDAATIDAQLDRLATEFVNHPRAVAPAGSADRTITVSSIYEWFKEDFGGSDAGVIEHLRHYAAPALAQRLVHARTLGGHRYDWSLNAP